jgi:hypothetical protein
VALNLIIRTLGYIHHISQLNLYLERLVDGSSSSAQLEVEEQLSEASSPQL